MPTEKQVVEIACEPEVLYNYIKQPWRWHEWHPNSKGAVASAEDLKVGDTFQEAFEIQLFSFLPIKLHRQLNWTVIDENPPSYWKITATTTDGLATFDYYYEPTDKGVRFTRSLNYELKGFIRLLGPIARRRNTKMSEVAVAGLVKRVEAGL